eukprot:TRINITY_DN112208_c0_g1_i1.p1 TRINITY_DN112208_c0_g1~~TRINITY_DN112208_c0_g1_i1.p1  ORF type:complete len:282 (-),score=78.26 TRINITY_DN112208_c0_g1_i1:140-985(-)
MGAEENGRRKGRRRGGAAASANAAWASETGGRWVPKKEPKEPPQAKQKRPAPGQSSAAEQRMIGFDFDCTITVRHFYKVFAWGYASGDPGCHPHFEAFAAWCQENDVDPVTKVYGQSDDAMEIALMAFCGQNGDDAFRKMFREVFMGGEERIAKIAAALKELKAAGVNFCIVTAGTSTAVLRALAVGAPELLEFLPSNRIWDTQQGRHSISSVTGQKILMLRDIGPQATKILFVDDAVAKDPPPEWVGLAAKVDVFPGPLPYEGLGLDDTNLPLIKQAILA